MTLALDCLASCELVFWHQGICTAAFLLVDWCEALSATLVIGQTVGNHGQKMQRLAYTMNGKQISRQTRRPSGKRITRSSLDFGRRQENVWVGTDLIHVWVHADMVVMQSRVVDAAGVAMLNFLERFQV